MTTKTRSYEFPKFGFHFRRVFFIFALQLLDHVNYSSASQKLANLVNITIARFIFLLSDENDFNIKVCSPVWFPNEVIYILLYHANFICAVYFCGMQTVYELQKLLALYVKTKQERYNRPTVTTSAMPRADHTVIHF